MCNIHEAILINPFFLSHTQLMPDLLCHWLLTKECPVNLFYDLIIGHQAGLDHDLSLCLFSAQSISTDLIAITWDLFR